MNFNFNSIFNGMFGQVQPGLCKLGVNGQVAIRTSSGYKTYNLKKNRLVNCTNFAFDIDGAFYVVPAFKVNRGDIVIINGKPRCVIEVNEITGNIKVFSYEDSTIDEVVPERHVFMGKTYCYGKIFSPFMNMGKNGGRAMSSMLAMSMMSGMFNTNSSNNGNSMSNMFPMMFMMNSRDNNPFMEMFDGAFNFGNEDEDENIKKSKTKAEDVDDNDEEDD